MKNSWGMHQSNKTGHILGHTHTQKIPEYVKMTDFHYKQIQYEFCSKGHTFVSPSNNMRQRDTFTHEP